MNEAPYVNADKETPSKNHYNLGIASSLSREAKTAMISVEQDEGWPLQPPRVKTPSTSVHVPLKENVPSEISVVAYKRMQDKPVDEEGQSLATCEQTEVRNISISVGPTDMFEHESPEEVEDLPLVTMQSRDISERETLEEVDKLPSVDIEPNNVSEIASLAEVEAPRSVRQGRPVAMKLPYKKSDKIGSSPPSSAISIGSSSISSPESDEEEEDQGVFLASKMGKEIDTLSSQDLGFDGSVVPKLAAASPPQTVIDKMEELEDSSVADVENESITEETRSTAEESGKELSSAEAQSQGPTSDDVQIDTNSRDSHDCSNTQLHSFDQSESFEPPDEANSPSQRPSDIPHMSEDATTVNADRHLDSTNISGTSVIQDLDSKQHRSSAVSSDSVTYPTLRDEKSHQNHETAKPRPKTTVEIIDLESEAEEDQQLRSIARAEPVSSLSGIVSQHEITLGQDSDISKSPKSQEDVIVGGTIDVEESITKSVSADPLAVPVPGMNHISGDENRIVDEELGQNRLNQRISTKEGQIKHNMTVLDLEDTSLSNQADAVQDLLPSQLRDENIQSLTEPPSTIPDSVAPSLKEQLPTPSTTQKTSFVSQPSTISLKSIPDEDTLPTPRLTQGTSTDIVASILPELPAKQRQPPTDNERPEESTSVLHNRHINEPTSSPPSYSPFTPVNKRSAFVERLKEMRKTSQSSPKARRSTGSNAASPWFAPKRSSQVVPDSEPDSGFSESADEVEKVTPKELPSIPATPEKPLAHSFIRSSPGENDAASVASSQYVPPSQPAIGGLRTNLSYFVPIAALRSHFGTQSDIFAVVVSTSSITRAPSGLRDFTRSLYITDYSVSKAKTPIITAQIFRPSRSCFPEVQLGDAILLRNFKVQSFQRRLSLLSTETSAWAVFHEGIEPQIRGPPVEYGAEERAFARGHWKWWASLNQDVKDYLQAAVSKEKVPPTKSKIKVKTEGINGMGVELPGSQEARHRGKKGDEWSTQALAKEWTVGIHSLEDHWHDSDMPVMERRSLRPRNARGRTLSESPEKEDAPPKNRKRGVKDTPRDRTRYVDDDSNNHAKEKQIGLRLHELRDGTKYEDRR